MNRQGKASAAFAFGGENMQIQLLSADGVEFVDGHVNMENISGGLTGTKINRNRSLRAREPNAAGVHGTPYIHTVPPFCINR